MIFRLSFRTAWFVAVSGVALSTFVTPPLAQADGLIGGFYGVNFGGNAESHSTVFGGMIGVVRPGGSLGFMVDFGYSPDFFKTEEDFGFKTSVTTIMGNVMIGGGARGFAPYLTAGAGLIRANINEASELVSDLSKGDFGINLGAGVNMFFGSSFGLQGDIRYFRSFSDDSGFLDVDLGDFDFWRATGGAVIRW